MVLNRKKHMWDNLEHRLHSRLYHKISGTNSTYVVLVGWEQIPAAWFQNLVENLMPEEWRLAIISLHVVLKQDFQRSHMTFTFGHVL